MSASINLSCLSLSLSLSILSIPANLRTRRSISLSLSLPLCVSHSFSLRPSIGLSYFVLFLSTYLFLSTFQISIYLSIYLFLSAIYLPLSSSVYLTIHLPAPDHDIRTSPSVSCACTFPCESAACHEVHTSPQTPSGLAKALRRTRRLHLTLRKCCVS